MPDVAIYTDEDGAVRVAVPAPGHPVGAGVPKGVPFRVIDSADLPDRESRAAWVDTGKAVEADPERDAQLRAAAAQARRAQAIGLLMASNEPRDVALRALIRDLYTQVNDLRERLGEKRTLEPEVIMRVVAGIGDGLGEV